MRAGVLAVDAVHVDVLLQADDLVEDAAADRAVVGGLKLRWKTSLKTLPCLPVKGTVPSPWHVFWHGKLELSC